MSVDVELADFQNWDDYVDRSPSATAFHYAGALEAMADHSGTELAGLVGYKGQEPVGVFPLFAYSVGPVRAAFSPPPDLRVPYLGPATLNLSKLKARKRERRRRRFVEGCLEWIDEEWSPRYLHVRTPPAFPDPRPFKDDCTVTPAFTYVVDLETDPEDLLMAFSSDARGNVRSTPDAVEMAVEGADAAERIRRQVDDRYAQQGIGFEVSSEFVADLYAGLPEGTVRPYVCRVDGEFAGGILALDDGETVYRWQGGVKGRDVDYPVNDLLDWRVMQDGIDRGRSGYDLVGAENERINRYKSKFAPDLRSYYGVERGTLLTTTVAGLYERFK